jgi:hypothetical protein
MDLITYLFTAMDRILMPVYRFPDNALLGYYLGTLVLSLACVIVGKYSISLAYHLNKKNIVRDNNEVAHFQSLSITALKSGDKEAFKASNSVVNDAFGKLYFSQIALAASYLWPVFVALGWMQYRFSEVTFSIPFSIPGIGNKVGYTITFILCYVIMRICIRKIGNQRSGRDFERRNASC